MKRIACSLLLGSLSFLGCHHGSSSSGSNTPPSGEIPNIAGTYTGSYTTNRVSGASLTLVLTQSGATLSGTFAGLGGAVQGTLAGTAGTNTFTFTINQTVPCGGTFTGTATINGTHLSGPFSGSSSCDGAESGTFTATKS